MKTSKSKMIQTVISLLIMFVAGYFIPTWGPVTRMGRSEEHTSELQSLKRISVVAIGRAHV